MHTLPDRFCRSLSRITLAAACLAAFGLLGTAQAQSQVVTPAQKATATQTAQTGVPLSALAAGAPDSYTVKRGDTLWGISKLYLTSPWRWPELWGMNLEDIRNPHRIFPGQQLFLEKANGRATLRSRAGSNLGPPTETVRVSPRTRFSSLPDNSIPTISAALIEPFLAEPLIVDPVEFVKGPRIVATQEGRVLLSAGDRAYARGQSGDTFTGKALSAAKGEPSEYRVFRNATPLKDPTTGAILGYEAQFLGRATLVRGESKQDSIGKDGKPIQDTVPATLDIVVAKEEIRTGDRLVLEPPPVSQNFVPRAPSRPISGQIVSMYGSSVSFAGENQVVVINRGSKDGLETGHVMAVQTDGERLRDSTDVDRTQIKLPSERNGLMMVFRTFENVSYALLLTVVDGVRAGDRFTNPK
jgi:LysM domain